LSGSSLVWRADGYFSTDPNDKDVVVFTCGHHYFRRTFVETVLPEFRRRMDQLPVPMPLTSQLVLTDYHQPQQMHAACPVCAFGSIRQDVQRTHPQYAGDKIKPWSL